MRGDQAVVTHAEQLVGGWDGQRGGEDAGGFAGAVGDEHDAGHAAVECQLGAHQPGHAAPKREEVTDLGRAVAQRLGPGHERRPPHRDPQQRQAPLQAGGGEVARGRQREVDDDAQRDNRPHPTPETAGGVRGQRRRRDGAQQGEPHGDVFKPRTREPTERCDQVLPQRGRVGLDALAGVEHRAVTGQEVAHRAQDNEAVVGHPPAGPPAPECEHARNCGCDERGEAGVCGHYDDVSG